MLEARAEQAMHLTAEQAAILVLVVALVFASFWIPAKRPQCPRCGCRRFCRSSDDSGRAMWCRDCGQAMRP